MNTESLAARHRSHLFLLALILGLAALLRFENLQTLGFWTDELCTLSAADGYGLQLVRIPANQIVPPLPVRTKLKQARSFWQIPAAMARDDSHPPVYFMLVRIWEDVFGQRELTVRSLNVIFSLLAILLLYFAARESIGSTGALIACLLMATATPQLQMSQEARNYMPVLVFALGAFIATQRLKRQPTLPLATLLSVCLLLMMLTHYFAAGAAAGICLFAVASLRNRARKLIMTSCVLSAVAFAILWGPAILHQRANVPTQTDWLRDAAPGHLQRRLIDLCRLPVRLFTEIADPRLQIYITVIGACMLLSLPWLYVARRELRPWICWLICAVGIVALTDLIRSTTQLNWIRYCLFATPPAYVILASAVRGKWKFFLPAVAIIAALLCLRRAYIPPWKTDFKSPAENIARRMQSTDGLVISGPDSSVDAVMFAAFQHYLPDFPKTTAMLTAPPDASTLAQLQKCPRIWLVWLWPNQPGSGFEIHESGRAFEFADLMLGRYPPTATGAATQPLSQTQGEPGRPRPGPRS